MEDYNNTIQSSDISIEQSLTTVMHKVYWYMFIGLLITAGAAYYTSINTALQELVFGNIGVFFGLIITEFILVIVLTSRAEKMSSTASLICFTLYALVNGITLSYVFMYYEMGSVFQAFGVSCAMFGAMAAYGYFTKKSLAGWGSFLFMGLIGLLIASIVGIFIMNDTFQLILCAAGVLLFVGITAYDTQRIKKRLMTVAGDTEKESRVATWGALHLYLDFINIFIRVLTIMGKRR